MIPVAASIVRTGPAGTGDGPVLRGPWAGWSGGPAADRPAETPRPRGTVRSWPLLVLAAPAAAEVWSGWVGIAQKTGFGLVSPLPGIWPSLHLDTTITLPVGVEAYAAYALRAWLGSEHQVSPRTRRFAKWSAICSFALGMAGQVAYHLLAQAGAVRAPWSVTMIVSCLPVLVLAMGTALAHMLRADAAADAAGSGTAEPGRLRPAARSHHEQAGPGRDQAAIAHPRTGSGPPAGTTVAPLRDRGTVAETSGPGSRAGQGADQGLLVARRLAAEGKPVSRRALRSNGITGSNEALSALARKLSIELGATAPDRS